MGAVYEARHTEQGTRAAVKVLNRELAQDTTLLERFRREAKITASLSNPHTVKVFGFDQPADGLPYMVMEYLEGEDLETRLKRVQRLTVPQANEVLRGLSVALTEAHQAGVVHRDLKPANIFYAREGAGERVKLLDFGLSKAMKLSGEGLTFFGQLLGTVWYMSPEQTRGGEATAASDIYSVGVVLYQALTGELPYSAGTPHEYLYRIQSTPPRPLTEVSVDLPPGLEAVLGQAMAKEPAARFATIRDLQEAFAGLFTMASDATSMSRAPSDPRMRAVPVTPRAVTDPKLRVAPVKSPSQTNLPSVTPRSKPPLPFKPLSDPNVKARAASLGVQRTVLSMPAPSFPTPQPMPAVSDATVVRPLMAPAQEGEDSTYVPSAAMDLPLVPDTEGATRVAAVPTEFGPATPVARPKFAPVARPTTDPSDEPAESTPPGMGLAKAKPPSRPVTDAEKTVPGGKISPFAPKSRPPSVRRPEAVVEVPDSPVEREASPLEGNEELAPAAEAAPPSSNVLILGLGIGAGLGAMLLLGALAWRFIH
jgi:serine/threonine-protein kinase